MSWWNNVISAVQNYFSPKPAVSNTVSNVQNSSPVSTMSSVPGQYNAASKSYNAPLKTSSPAPSSTPSSPSYASSSGGSSSGNNNVPSSSGSSQGVSAPSILDGLSTNVENAKAAIARASAPIIGKASKALTTVGTALNAPQLKQGGLGAAGQNWAGFQEIISEAERRNLAPQLNEALKQYAEATSKYSPELLKKSGIENYGDLGSQALTAISGQYGLPDWLKSAVSGLGKELTSTDLYRFLQQRQPSNVQTGAAGTLPGAAKTSTIGQILPSAAATGAPAQADVGIIPSPATTPRNAIVPSAVQSAALPANMQGLTSTNVNVPLAKAMTPEAIQSIGQLLLRSILGNQSTMSSLSPGLAQALWGAPTASSAFGGYEGGAAVPSQTSISQPKNIPPLPAVLNRG
jgi:hypothetical protein